MNRILLIGNGFDRAHGLNTGYNHFINDYFKSALVRAQNIGVNDDILLKIALTNNENPFTIPDEFSDIPFGKIYQDCINHGFSFKFKSAFFSDLWRSLVESSKEANWVDIERLYYVHLKKVLSKHEENKTNKSLLELNEQFEFLTDRLIEYLKKEEERKSAWISENEYLTDLMLKNVLNVFEMSSINPDKIKKVYAINFNYTGTFRKFYAHNQVDEIQIHGQLLKPGSIIFGYGDEKDNDYSAIENTHENEYLKHIKSFKYFQNNNYQKISDIISNENFEVYVLGHSLGVSDRTLLSQIFDSDRLAKVSIFYHETKEDYDQKTFNLSRHFKDKIRLRTKIVPFPNSNKFPQSIKK